MLVCPKCRVCDWDYLYRSPIDPTKDKFKCRKCGHVFFRYDEPIKKEPTDEDRKERACDPQ